MINRKVSLKNLSLPDDLKKLSVFQCEKLCREIRKILVNTVMKNGGHLSSNLGVVELTVAIHRVFSSPDDKIIWDVGHQAYTHKLLTGRYKSFDTLRKENGISGFSRPSESEHDAFISGHSSTSVSVACGMARAMKLNGDNHHAIAVIGDGAFTGGMAYEGLNNAGKSGDNIIVILNHNDMSISKNVGALAKYLTSIRGNQTYLNAKRKLEKILDRTPIIGKPVKNILKSSKSAVKWALYHTTMFEDLGFVYLGPVDGHNIKELEETFRMAKRMNKPVFIHVNTIKGKGFKPAEKNPGAFHGISPIEKCSNPEIISEDSYSAVFGKELLNISGSDENICAVTAAMKYGTGLQYFAEAYPERFFDVGIAEQHAITFAGGLAKMGKLPVVAVYSSFLQRAYDQIIHDLSIDKLHVVLAVDRAGIAGEDGETHQGIFDVSMLTSIPGAVIFSPSCYEEVQLCLNEALYNCTGVAAVRYPRGCDCSSFEKAEVYADYFYSGKTKDILTVTYGRIYQNLIDTKCADKSDYLKLVKIFPVEKEIVNICCSYKKIIVFEEVYELGGIGEHIMLALNKNGYCVNVEIHGINEFVKQSSAESALAKYGLDTVSMRSIIETAWEKLS
jgi:1-deoxy-D-xylulose-5-phosphate synthase